MTTTHPPKPALSPNKRKNIVWNEDNLMYNEKNKSAKMTIDEPDTPWASPPRELFEDPAEDDEGNKIEPDMDDVANRLRDIDTAGGSGSEGHAGSSSAREMSSKGNQNQPSEWDSSDDEASEKRTQKLSFPAPGDDPARDEYGEAEDFEAHTDADRELKARLFEAQRKSHQCTFRGVIAKGKAMLEEDDDE